MDDRFVQMLRVVQLRYQAFAAAVAVGAEAILLKYVARPPLTGLPDYVVETVARADILVDLSFITWAYSESWARLAELERTTGLRRFLPQTWGLEEDVETLINTPPDADLVSRTERANQLINSAHAVRLTSDLGTDLTVERGDPSARITFAPAGQVAFAPPEGSANGVIQYVGGFRMQAPALQKRRVYEPVRMEVENGRLVSISRDTETGIMLDEWFRSHRDPTSYQFAHINLGLDPRVQYRYLDNVSVHFKYGAVLLGFGANFDPIHFGASVARCKSHIDMSLLGADLALDGRTILERGEFTADSGLQAALAVAAG
jgi:leucyl aminopeptidase (aminopeptidase T)